MEKVEMPKDFSLLIYSKHNLRVSLPITIGTHGVRMDDDPADDPGLRPLYHSRAPTGPDQRINLTMDDDDDDDEMGEIDHSLFESGPGPKGGRIDNYYDIVGMASL